MARGVWGEVEWGARGAEGKIADQLQADDLTSLIEGLIAFDRTAEDDLDPDHSGRSAKATPHALANL